MTRKDLKAPLGRIIGDPTKPSATPALRKGAHKPAPQPPCRAQPRQTAPAESQATASPPISTGKTAAIWLDDEDRAILRKASILALKQGLKPSDSLILRAALRMMPLSPHLMDHMQALIERDGRKRRHQKQASKGQ